MHRILLVDDHPLMRKGLAMTLDAEPDFTIAAQTDSAENALSLIEEKDPIHLAIIDISLPGMSGLELVKHLEALHPEVGALVVSRHDETLYAERSIRAGAKGYVMKLEASDVIVEAARRVLQGGIYVSQQINERLLMSMATGNSLMKESPLELLSDRELEVFELIGQGVGTRDIAERLHLATKTVESYRARIKEKMNLSSATELMQHAVQWVQSEGAT